MKNLIAVRRLMGALFLKFLLITILLMAFSFSYAQNVGIGIDNPTEKLQVGGIVHSMADGFRFPDGTLQTTASSGFEPGQASENRLLAVLECSNPDIPGPFSFGSHTDVIKILSYQWGMTSEDAGGGSSNIAINHVVIMKDMDMATNKLLKNALEATVMMEMWLFFYWENEGVIEFYYKVKLNEVTIRAFSQQLVYKGGEQYGHLDIIAFEFQAAIWEYNDGSVNNEAEWPPGP